MLAPRLGVATGSPCQLEETYMGLCPVSTTHGVTPFTMRHQGSGLRGRVEARVTSRVQLGLGLGLGLEHMHITVTSRVQL